MHRSFARDRSLSSAEALSVEKWRENGGNERKQGKRREKRGNGEKKRGKRRENGEIEKSGVRTFFSLPPPPPRALFSSLTIPQPTEKAKETSAEERV